MNKLPTHKRVAILKMLVEGTSMRAISRTVDVSINTVSKLLVDAGYACAEYHDQTVREVTSRRVECDEIWSFCYAKNKNVTNAKSAPDGAGDVWTWTGLDVDSRMILAFEIGDRSTKTAIEFLSNLHSRLANKVQLNTDAHKAYFEAVDTVFGSDVDYAQLVKIYGESEDDKKGKGTKYPTCIGFEKLGLIGEPNMKEVSTSYVERMNLTMRMGMRRFTRKTNGFSKKLENHLHMLSLYFVYYNFVKIHKTLKVTPAMAAEVTDKLYDMEWIVGLIDAREAKPNRPTHYQTKNSQPQQLSLGISN